MHQRISVDFGATRVRLSFRTGEGGATELLRFGDEDYLPWAPALFHLPTDGGPIAFGHAARHALETDPAGVVDLIPRRLSNGRIRAANGRVAALDELMTAMLTDLRERAGREIPVLDGAMPAGVALVVPNAAAPATRASWQAAAAAAGFTDVFTIEQANAAAAEWIASSADTSRGLVVLDCGGASVQWAWLGIEDGTLELARAVPPGGLPATGGFDIDAALLEHVREPLGIDMLSPAERRTLLERLAAVKEAASGGADALRVRTRLGSIVLDRETIALIARTSFVDAVAADFRAFLDAVAAANGGSVPPVAVTGGAGKTIGLCEALAAAGCMPETWDGGTDAAVRGAARFAPSLTGPAKAPVDEPFEGSAALNRLGIDETDVVYQAALCIGLDDFDSFRGHLTRIVADPAEVPQSFAAAVRLLRAAANRGEGVAQSLLGTLYEHGRGVEASPAEACLLYRAAAEQNIADAMVRLSGLLAIHQEFEREEDEVIRWLLAAVNEFHPHATYLAGILFETGEGGVSKSTESAARMFEWAADHGHKLAKAKIGIYYLSGIGVEENNELGAAYLQQAVDNDCHAACYYLGRCYQEGWGVEPSPEQAAALFQRGTNHGDFQAQAALGFCYLRGSGVERSLRYAVANLKPPADAGDAESQNAMGFFHLKGLFVEESRDLARQYYTLAAEQGNEAARDALEGLK